MKLGVRIKVEPGISISGVRSQELGSGGVGSQDPVEIRWNQESG